MRHLGRDVCMIYNKCRTINFDQGQQKEGWRMIVMLYHHYYYIKLFTSPSNSRLLLGRHSYRWPLENCDLEVHSGDFLERTVGLGRGPEAYPRLSHLEHHAGPLSRTKWKLARCSYYTSAAVAATDGVLVFRHLEAVAVGDVQVNLNHSLTYK